MTLYRRHPQWAAVGQPFNIAPFNAEEQRESARGDLARGLLWLLTFAIGGILAFVGLGRLDGTVITQSIFPSLVALAGTALGFYFGSSKSGDAGTPGSGAPATVNQTPPVANAGPDQNATVGATVTLKGSGTVGSTGTQLTYAWTLLHIPPGSKATLSGAGAASVTFVADQPGTYEAQLIVNDGTASTPSTTHVTAGQGSGAANATAPVAKAGPDQTVKVASTVTLDGGTSTGDQTKLTYGWSLANIPQGSNATLSAANTASPNFVPDLPGTYAVQLIVDDGTPSAPAVTKITASS